MITLAALVLLSPATTILAQTYAFGPTCQYSTASYNYPNEITPGEQFTISLSLPTVCPQANNYHVMARFDVVNDTGWVLASNYTQYGFLPNNGKPFTFLVTNSLTAPSQPGPWRLQFILYAFISEDDADGLDYKVTTSETIQVAQPTIVQTINSTGASTSSQSATLSMTSSPTITQSTALVAGAASNSNELYYAIAAAIVVLLAIATVIIKRRTHSDGKTQQEQKPAER